MGYVAVVDMAKGFMVWIIENIFLSKLFVEVSAEHVGAEQPFISVQTLLFVSTKVKLGK